MLGNNKFKAIEDLKNLRASEGQEAPLSGVSVSGHTKGYSIIEGMIRQSTNNPIKNPNSLSLEEYSASVKNSDADSSK